MPSCNRCTNSRRLPASCRLPSGDEEGARLRSARIAYTAVIALSPNDLDVNACGYLRYLGCCTSAGASMRLRVEGILESSLYVSDLDRSARFYKEIVGFPVISDFRERGCALQAG